MTAPTLRLDTMQFFGRLASDYHAMFGVTLQALSGQRILDCPSGPCSFVAEAVAAGVDAVGVDPLYIHTHDELRARCELDIAGTINAMSEHGDHYSTLDLNVYAANKRAALHGFLADYEVGRAAGRYVAASLPQLPFADQSFDQTFSAHLLVTYSSPESGGILTNSPFTEQWHQAAITELLRVTKRALHVYPTTTRTSPARRHTYLEHIVAQLQASGAWTCRYQPSTYHRGDSAQNLLNASLVIERVSSDHATPEQSRM
jgi:hypothetical protein